MKTYHHIAILVTAVAGIFGAQSAIAQTPANIQTPVTAEQTLNPNDTFGSGDGRFKVAFQGDGNLVLYQGTGSSKVVLWSAGVQIGAPPPLQFPAKTVFQNDGNLVVYWQTNIVGSEFPVWESNTDGNPGAILDVQNDGNFVIKRANGTIIWSTNTCCH